MGYYIQDYATVADVIERRIAEIKNDEKTDYKLLVKHIDDLKKQMHKVTLDIQSATFDRPNNYNLIIEEGYEVNTGLMNQYLLKTIFYVLSNGGFSCNIFTASDKSYHALEILLDHSNRAYNPIIMTSVTRVYNDDTSVIAKIKITPGLHAKKINEVIHLLELVGLVEMSNGGISSVTSSDTKFSITFQKTFKAIYDESILEAIKDTEIISSLGCYRDLVQSTTLTKMGLLNTSLKLDMGYYSNTFTLTQHKYVPMFNE